MRYMRYALCALFLAGCGYTTRSMISSEYKTIYIPPFANRIDITRDSDVSNRYRIYKPNLETDVSKAVVSKFLWDGNLKPVKEGNADLILKGELTEFRRDPVRYDDNDNVLEYRINVVVSLTMSKGKDGSLVWQENGFTGDYTYFVSGPAAKSDDTAVSEAVTDLSRRIVERAVEQW